MAETVLLTGSNGLVGSKFVDDFQEKYIFETMDLSDPINPVDITNEIQVMEKLENSSADFVVHFAAYTDVTGAFKQSGDKNGVAYKVNVDGTKNLVKACQEFNKHLIHISTAYVFDGNKDGLYQETDLPNPIEWYGQTKLWAEEAVANASIDSTILRIDQPFRTDAFAKKDIVHRILDGLDAGTLYPQFNNHYFGPTFIDDFAKILDFVIRTKTTGLFNASSGEKWTDYDFANLVATLHDKDVNLVKAGDLDEYLKTLDRPYQRNTAMDATKLKNILDFELKTVREAVAEVS